MKLGSGGSRRGIWIIAILLSLLLHVGAILGVKALRLFRPETLRAQDPPPIEMVFADNPSEPRSFTELPEDRADEAPDEADFLSNLQSRARDLAEGGNDDGPPRSEGLGETPQVRMDRAAASLAELGARPQSEQSDTPDTNEETVEAPPERVTTGLSALPREEADAEKPEPNEKADPAAEFRRRYLSFASPDGSQAQTDPSDIFQESLDNPGGNAILVGDYSLDTTAWVYGYWMQRFRRKVQDNWYTPYAFRLGILEGWTLVELEVARDGRLLRCDVVDEKGHESLRYASVTALELSSPFEAFPDDVPEPSLTLRLKMIYGRVRAAGER